MRRYIVWVGALLVPLGVGLGGCPEETTKDPEDCGNGQLDQAEDCDGETKRDQTCEDVGYGVGALGCREDCSYDTADCVLEGQFPTHTTDCTQGEGGSLSAASGEVCTVVFDDLPAEGTVVVTVSGSVSFEGVPSFFRVCTHGTLEGNFCGGGYTYHLGVFDASTADHSITGPDESSLVNEVIPVPQEPFVLVYEVGASSVIATLKVGESAPSTIQADRSQASTGHSALISLAGAAVSSASIDVQGR